MDGKIREFLAVPSDGDGCGDGSGYGYGDGSGYGRGYGDGSGDGSGYGGGYGHGGLSPTGGKEDTDMPMLPSEDAVFRQALETYGPQTQTMMAMEEMAELAKELCKASRGLGSV